MRSLVLLLLLFYGSAAQSAGWKPFCPYDLTRTHERAMKEMAVRTDPVAKAFWRELLNEVPTDKHDRAKEILIEKGEVVKCDGTVRLTIARAKPNGTIEYFDRLCEVGEPIVTVKKQPKYSAYCCNPISDWEQPKKNWEWVCTRSETETTVEYWKEENGWGVPGFQRNNLGIGLLHSEQSIPIKSGSGGFSCKQVQVP